MDMPTEKRALLDRVVASLRGVQGMKAIALGGSHARGTQRPDSDLDVGLYYRESAPFAIEDVRRIAVALSASGAPTVTDFYGWGPFVNGGAWIDNSVSKIDFLYRNLDQLERQVADAQAGNWSHSFDQQPPFGFRSVTLLGEIHCCRPLHDPGNVLGPLKSAVAVFPPKLKARIVQDTLWCADFSFQFADAFAKSGDVANTVACMTRIFHYLVHALYALNKIYFMNDKRMSDEIARFPMQPRNFGQRIATILAAPGRNTESLNASLTALRALFDETKALAADLYRPRY